MRYTVIGLGQFGQELCTELSARNIEVVAVASTDEELEQIKDLVTYAVVTDYTNPAALRELELDDQSAVIVAIGDSFEENLLVVTHLQKMGVRYIYARVMSPVHEHILSQMNVYALINLSRVASKQLASLVTLLYAMKHRGAHKGLATLCIGGGMGCATIVEMD